MTLCIQTMHWFEAVCRMSNCILVYTYHTYFKPQLGRQQIEKKLFRYAVAVADYSVNYAKGRHTSAIVIKSKDGVVIRWLHPRFQRIFTFSQHIWDWDDFHIPNSKFGRPVTNPEFYVCWYVWHFPLVFTVYLVGNILFYCTHREQHFKRMQTANTC